MHSFCTLFDSKYISRGLAMYDSLVANCPNMHLYVFSFDDLCFEILKQLNLPKMTVVSLSEFEDEELLSVKKDRSVAEYCWTCTPSIIKYCIEKYSLECCTYLDADLYFWSNPSVLIDEMGSKSVLITEHRYTKRYDQTKTSGKYCVQFMTFKNTQDGMGVLQWWRNACIDWCYARFEDGKFGDQKYLEDWMQRFDCVHELKHLGGGIAPWNVQQYSFFDEDGALKGLETLTNASFEMVFFHFHYVRFYSNKKVELGQYKLSKNVLNTIYAPYFKALWKAESLIKKAGYNIDPHWNQKYAFTWKTPLRVIKRTFFGNYNIYKISSFEGLRHG